MISRPTWGRKVRIMRTDSLAALMFGALFLFGCPNNPITDDDDTTADDDDDATPVRDDVTIHVGDLEKFMGFDGDGTEAGGTSLGYQYLSEFQIMIAPCWPGTTDPIIGPCENTEIEGHEVTFPGDGSPVFFTALSEGIVHATRYGKVVTDGKVRVTDVHHEDYLGFYPEFETDDVVTEESGSMYVSYQIEDGESLTIPVNYDSTGIWQCWFGSQTESHSVSHQLGEVFDIWFHIDIVLFGNGHLLKNTLSDGADVEGTISANGSTLTGVAKNEFDSWVLSCNKS